MCFGAEIHQKGDLQPTEKRTGQDGGSSPIALLKMCCLGRGLRISFQEFAKADEPYPRLALVRTIGRYWATVRSLTAPTSSAGALTPKPNFSLRGQAWGDPRR